jgi:2-methylcitrate dehydratase PrpD
VFGGVAIDDILADRNRHPEVARLTAGFQLVPDPALDAEWPERYVSEVVVHARDGRTLVRRVTAARGTPENPMTADEVRDKYRQLAGGVAPAVRVEGIRRLVERLDRLPDVRGLARLLRAPMTGRRSRPPA